MAECLAAHLVAMRCVLRVQAALPRLVLPRLVLPRLVLLPVLLVAKAARLAALAAPADR